MRTPFHNKKGRIKFPWSPTGDRVFIFPCPPPETFIEGGVIEIPVQFREDYKKEYGILLAVGPGFTDKAGKWRGTPPELIPGSVVVYDVSVPWRAQVEGLDGNNHVVVLCGVTDILGVDNGQHYKATV